MQLKKLNKKTMNYNSTSHMESHNLKHNKMTTTTVWKKD